MENSRKSLFKICQERSRDESACEFRVELANSPESVDTQKILHNFRAALTAVRLSIEAGQDHIQNPSERDRKKAAQVAAHLENLTWAVDELERLP